MVTKKAPAKKTAMPKAPTLTQRVQRLKHRERQLSLSSIIKWGLLFVGFLVALMLIRGERDDRIDAQAKTQCNSVNFTLRKVRQVVAMPPKPLSTAGLDPALAALVTESNARAVAQYALTRRALAAVDCSKPLLPQIEHR